MPEFKMCGTAATLPCPTVGWMRCSRFLITGRQPQALELEDPSRRLGSPCAVPGTLLPEERKGAQHPGPACSLWCESPSSSGGPQRRGWTILADSSSAGDFAGEGQPDRPVDSSARSGKGIIIWWTELCCLRRGTNFSPAVTILSPYPHLEFLNGRGISQKGCGRKPCQARGKVATPLS